MNTDNITKTSNEDYNLTSTNNKKKINAGRNKLKDPKPPQNMYQLYVLENRTKVVKFLKEKYAKENNSEKITITQKEVNSEIGKRYIRLTEEERNKYKNLVEEDKNRYKMELETLENEKTENDKKEKNKKNKNEKKDEKDNKSAKKKKEKKSKKVIESDSEEDDNNNNDKDNNDDNANVDKCLVEELLEGKKVYKKPPSYSNGQNIYKRIIAAQVQKENPGITKKELAKLNREKWFELSSEERAKWNKLSKLYLNENRYQFKKLDYYIKRKINLDEIDNEIKRCKKYESVEEVDLEYSHDDSCDSSESDDELDELKKPKKPEKPKKQKVKEQQKEKQEVKEEVKRRLLKTGEPIKPLLVLTTIGNIVYEKPFNYLNEFYMYYSAIESLVKKEKPNLQPEDYLKLCSEKWNYLSNKERKQWKNLAILYTAKYIQEYMSMGYYIERIIRLKESDYDECASDKENKIKTNKLKLVKGSTQGEEVYSNTDQLEETLLKEFN